MESSEPRKFASELGDLLLQVVFHSILAEETGAFTISDVIESIHTKMVRRHPHVFGDAKAKDSAAVLKNWEQIKAEERAEAGGNGSKRAASAGAANPVESILAGVPRSLPAVLEAYQLTRRAAHIGFDWDNLIRHLRQTRRRKARNTRVAQSAAPQQPSVAQKRAPAAPEESAVPRHAVPPLRTSKKKSAIFSSPL